ncbi:trypsin-like cysteine/serine peptidase domain-containing protein [Penicillium diatomitis]|uniref:Trypsin-like cysteine/serine peptidase domain-containing protein n=1 Tax=Penicillium diatomitis TaxID=2819901 RepID=A0A9X0C289_9EURO|nr:trypsin-like cysteine/serine peptidase domain-containing protein [Penicillium diatomitis]KAJ5495337.1 trypsin-like cysteine/serine peptidase domain-containing protein [Penicillium diatomitis]
MKTYTVATLLLSVVGLTLANDDIVGGQHAAIGEFPYQVSVQTSSHRCGGSIIDKNHILTAAHCVDGLTAQRLRIRAGSLDRNSGGQFVKVSKVIAHAGYDAKSIANDMAILRLASSLTFGSRVAAVKLPSSTDDTPQVGTRCSVTGWGTTSPGGASMPSNLLVAYVNIVDHQKCAKEYADQHPLDDKMICAGVRAGGKGACDGDGGGPLVDASTGKQVGVVSSEPGCGKHNKDGVYASTAAYLDWIRNQTAL